MLLAKPLKGLFFLIFLVVVLLALVACGSSGNKYTDKDISCEGGGICGTGPPKKGMALLGPVVGATVAVYDIFDRETPLCQVTTVDSRDFETAGSFQIPADCIAAGDKLYLIQVSGGEDVDKDDDKVFDEVPTPVLGTFHAFVSSQQMRDQEFRVTAISEAIFQSVQNLLDSGISEAEILKIIDDNVDKFIQQDINNDGVIDGKDVLSFDPRINITALSPYTDKELLSAIEDIQLARNSTYDEVALEGAIRARFDTLSAAMRVHIDDRNVAYVTTKTALIFIDVQDPLNPTLLGAYPTGWIYDLVVDRDIAYIALGALGVELVDVSDLAKPRLLGRSEMGSAFRLDIAKQFELENRVMYASQQDIGAAVEIGVIDQSEPSAPILVELMRTPQPSLSLLTQMAIHEDYCVVSSSSFVGHENHISTLSVSEGRLAIEPLSTIELDGSYSTTLDSAVVPRNGVDQLYLSVGELEVDLLEFDFEFKQQFLAFDLDSLDSDNQTPAPLTMANPGLNPKPLSLLFAGDNLISWEENHLLNYEFVDVGDPETVSFDFIGAAGLPNADTMLDISPAISQLLIALRTGSLVETGGISLLNDTFNFSQRIAIQGDYAFLAAGQFGFLVLAIPGEAP